ncbi:oligosaccharide flippase family protein [Sulfitobacter geojensis]|uniref:oligosaccharide flippase family protein n=1 Tax=Sulfitobacter geojensis TaxID=1342299 RepID=UPI00056AD751|nr:oligosaccharide flippase family protein [Sulfitobacter geojensis]
MPQGPKAAGGFFGTTLLARAARGSTWTALTFVISQGARFLSNLILARLLFPESFGIMALVTMMLIGLTLISDMGIAQSIMQSKRGDDPDFLDTAWTLQIMRGAVLWIAACALALPAAAFYEQPVIALMLPLAAISLLLAAFEPIRVETANRHLLIGRVTALDLAATITGIVAMVVLAWVTRSTWALVAGWVVTAIVRLALMWLFLPGRGNRLHWEKSAGTELLHFGLWIFLSSICGLLVSQGDRAILGKFLSIDGLGIYNIGMFLASFPLMLGTMITSRVLIPLYREHLNTEDQTARKRLFKLRYYLTALMLAVLFVLALIGPWVVQVLYDSRYVAAGGIIVAVASVQMITVVSLTYDQAALATGDSRGFFGVSLTKALLSTGGFLIGVSLNGLFGAVTGLGIALLLYHPFIVLLARRHKAWDGRHDVLFLPLAVLLGALAIWVNWTDVQVLIPGSVGALDAR